MRYYKVFQTKDGGFQIRQIIFDTLRAPQAEFLISDYDQIAELSIHLGVIAERLNATTPATFQAEPFLSGGIASLRCDDGVFQWMPDTFYFDTRAEFTGAEARELSIALRKLVSMCIEASITLESLIAA